MISGANSGKSTSAIHGNQDVVGIFENFTQVFRDARPMTASVKEESKLMEHPTEDGAVITDHAVVQPVEIELIMTLTPATFRDTYKEIKRLYLEKKILTVQTKAETYENQLIQAIPHEETPEVFDSIILTLKLKEVIIVTAEFKAEYKPKKTAQAKTQDNGEVQPQEKKGSWASKNLPIGK